MSEIFGDKYKIGFDESWNHPGVEDRKSNQKWYEQILCAKGAFIYLHSESPTVFALYTPSIRKAKLIALEMPECKADLMDGEAVIYFPEKLFHKIAKLAGARRKRKLSEAHKEKLAKSNVEHRFKKKVDGSILPK
jgi:hypothetical protein